MARDNYRPVFFLSLRIPLGQGSSWMGKAQTEKPPKILERKNPSG